MWLSLDKHARHRVAVLRPWASVVAAFLIIFWGSWDAARAEVIAATEKPPYQWVMGVPHWVDTHSFEID
ncbi:MAG TPA: hypothetical protein VJU83_02070, partial [Burkholderiales bacterium]|nr:hypothetical protein [Burkholderiales bacterium]